MTGYSELVSSYGRLRQNIAVFRKVILHSHSPGSYDYRMRISREEYESGLKSCGVEMIAVTDHMKCELACGISKVNTTEQLCVLPGMEINIKPPAPWNSFRIHVLAIFPERYSLEQICKILPGELPEEEARNGKEEIQTELRDFIRSVHSHGGICVAAHIDSKRGVRKAFRQLGRDGISLYSQDLPSDEEDREIGDEFKEWLLSAGFDAIEVGKQADKEHYRWIRNIAAETVSVPVLLNNDAHTIEDLDLPPENWSRFCERDLA